MFNIEEAKLWSDYIVKDDYKTFSVSDKNLAECFLALMKQNDELIKALKFYSIPSNAGKYSGIVAREVLEKYDKEKI